MTEFRDLPPLMRWVMYAWCVTFSVFITVLLMRYVL